MPDYGYNVVAGTYREVLAGLHQRRLVVDGPPNLEVTLRRGRDFLAVNLVNRAVNPTLTNHLHVVEQVPPTGPVTVSVRLPGKPAQVTLEPGGRALAWSYAEGWLRVEVPSVHIHDIVVLVGQSPPASGGT